MAKREKSAFALRLCKARKKAGFSQEDVAKHLNIHRSTYTKYETDATHVNQVYLVALAELFGVTTDYLLGKEDIADPLLREDMPAVQLNAQEQELLSLFRRMTPEQRQAMLGKGRELNNTQGN